VIGLSTLATQVLLNHDNLERLFSDPQGALRRAGIPQNETETIAAYLLWVQEELEKKLAEGLDLWWT
jgi:hypothetical protein